MNTANPAGEQTIAQVLANAVRLLSQSSDSARIDAELLLCHVLQQSRTYLMTWPERSLDSEQYQTFETLLKRRHHGEPVAYLTGERGFWTLTLQTDNSTLIPRPDTECLVERALDLCLPETATVLDVGTGTGAIALAIASERPKWQLHACDLNPDAVSLADSNARRLGLNNVEIIQSHWFDAYDREFYEAFDLIVGNPPYIDKNDQHLRQGDVRFEPLTALVSEAQGLADIKHIVSQSHRFMKPGGYLMLEHGYDQGMPVREIFVDHGFTQVMTHQDLGNNERFTEGKKS